MAFCSECGKSNPDPAVVCEGCGKPIRAAAKAAAPARFKGTMIMGATVPKPAGAPASPPVTAPEPAAPVPPANLAFQATIMGPMTAPGGSAPPPAAAHVPAVVVPAARAISPKGTMIGGMGGLPGAFPPPATPPAVVMPTPAAVQPQTPAGYDVPSSTLQQQAAAASPDVAYGAAGIDYSYSGSGAPKAKSNTWLWVALGVVGALGFACVGTGLAVYFGAVSLGDKAAEIAPDAPK